MSSAPPPFPTPAQGPYSSPQVTIVLTVTLLVFFFAGFFSVYICRCLAENNRVRNGGANSTPNATQTSTFPGLDVNIIETFPKFKYSAVKDLKKGEIGLECAICLSEFLDEDFLRLLNICCHVFHQECVDLWLESHKTCPVCRTALDSPPDEKSMAKVSNDYTQSPANEFYHERHESDGSVRIDVKQDDHVEKENQMTNESSSVRIFITDDDETQNTRQHNNEIINKRRAIAEKFSRSCSTGHSIFRNKIEDVEKYTLRLPEHVREEITKGHHQCVKSCTDFAEYSKNSANPGNGFGEMSGTSGGNVDDKV